jgi:hypothetical protein
MSLRHTGTWRYSSAILISALDGEWSASRPSLFTLGKGATGTHLVGGWLVPEACLDAVE